MSLAKLVEQIESHEPTIAPDQVAWLLLGLVQQGTPAIARG